MYNGSMNISPTPNTIPCGGVSLTERTVSVKILKLDKTGHTTIDTNIDVEFRELVRKGYAMFVNDTKIKSLESVPDDSEILALAPLVGG